MSGGDYVRTPSNMGMDPELIFPLIFVWPNGSSAGQSDMSPPRTGSNAVAG